MSKAPGISMDRIGQLLRGVFEILIENPDGLSGRVVMDRLPDRVPFTDYEVGHYPSNPVENRGIIATRFWTVNCVKAGWLTKSRATWQVTEDGKTAYARFADPGEFARESQRRYNEWKSQQTGNEAAVEVDEPTVGDIPVAPAPMNVELAEEAAWTHVASHLSAMDPFDFQNLVAALLRAMGYHVAWISPPGPDRGIDIVAYTDPLGASGPRIKVQVKRRSDKTTVDGIRAFLAVLGNHDIGLFISTGGFTSDAQREARSQENRRLTLIDMEKLFDLWVENYKTVNEVDRGLLPIRPVYFLASWD